jgi:hypothetical protein
LLEEFAEVEAEEEEEEKRGKDRHTQLTPSQFEDNSSHLDR